MPCPKCNGRLDWKERSWTSAGEDPGHWSCIMCGEVVYPHPVKTTLSKTAENVGPLEVSGKEGSNTMAYHLDSEKEERVRSLLKDRSVREIVAETGVAKNTIMRIRDENFTPEERERLKKQGMSRARIRTELAKKGVGVELENRGRNIPSTNSGEKGGQEMTRTDKGKECSREECKRSGQVLPFTEFNKNRATPDGYEYHCRVCKAEEAEARRKRIKRGGAGNGRRKKQPLALKRFVPVVPGPAITDVVTLDVQLLRAVKKSAILDFVKNDLPKMVEEAFV